MPSTAETIALLAMSCGFAQAEETDLVDLVKDTPDLSVLFSLVGKANDLASTLSNVTVFAPLNKAFNDNLAPEIVTKLTGDPDLLEDVLKFHVVAGIENSTQLLAETTVKTEQGGSVDVTASANLKVFVEQSEVITADVKALDGIAHLIDYVLFPNILGKTDTTVVEVATQAQNDHRTLSQLLIAAELTAPLSNDSAQLTLFAPTNQAFAEDLNKELTGKLMEAANVKVLQDVLKFHVVASNTVIDDTGVETATLEGSNLSVNGSTVFVDGKAVANITANVTTSGPGNAVVVIIDRVLVPKDVDLNALLGSDDGDSGISTTVYIILYVLAALACLTIIGVVVAVGMRNKRRAAGYQAAEEGYDMK